MALLSTDPGLVPPRGARGAAVPGALAALALTGVLTIGASLWVMRLTGAEPRLAWTAAILFAGAAAIILRGLPQHPFHRFGPANAVTVLRAGMTAFAGAMVLASGQFVPGAGGAEVWAVLGLAGAALALDGVDGWLARRSGLASDYGARFDMEVDAALILLLSLAAWQLDKAGPWVVAIGAMRYAFVGAQWVVPRLGARLPPSLRRKIVCVAQIAGLCLVALPPVPPALSAPLAALTLAALAWSFAVDIRWLMVRPVAFLAPPDVSRDG
ncbi:CDP-alcohol phosphatidyltransferase family protein [Frigidibacter sp. MR17.24]|uniref:CDP-alcohol phosphatidyltransferase family protein n=1 Tax=Frigidibacter sp. MR17.24 TaxID=3127345 RepID=UPI003012CAE0